MSKGYTDIIVITDYLGKGVILEAIRDIMAEIVVK